MIPLAERFLQEGRTMQVVTAYAQQYVNEHWQQVWQEHLPAIEQIYAKSGEPAYAKYGRELFQPLEDELERAGLICEQGIPGKFPLSLEQWGPWEERERRFWSVLRLSDDEQILGTLVTRFFHDHTHLRIPQPPIMLAVSQTEPEAITQAIQEL